MKGIFKQWCIERRSDLIQQLALAGNSYSGTRLTTVESTARVKGNISELDEVLLKLGGIHD